MADSILAKINNIETGIVQVEKSEKTGVAKNGGARAGSGRKPLLKVAIDHQGIMDAELDREVELPELYTKWSLDKKTKMSSLQAVLRMLHAAAMVGSIPAASVWLDRTLGKPLQKIGGGGEPIRVNVDVDVIVLKAYGIQ